MIEFDLIKQVLDEVSNTLDEVCHKDCVSHNDRMVMDCDKMDCDRCGIPLLVDKLSAKWESFRGQ
jgi:hypothetical protein